MEATVLCRATLLGVSRLTTRQPRSPFANARSAAAGVIPREPQGWAVRGVMNSNARAVMFGRASDEWETPQDLFDALHQEFVFGLDAAATYENTKCKVHLGRHWWPSDVHWRMIDGLTADWRGGLALGCREGGVDGSVWLNPPYSKCAEFVAKARYESLRGVTTVALLPSRTDTRWWHDHVWQTDRHVPRDGVEVRFLKGRLRLSGAKHSAPFPSVIVVFRGAGEGGSFP